MQVKSKESNDPSKDRITYPIRTNDLHKHLTDNGVMCFVVYVTNDGTTRIYYTDLLPFKIKQLLNDAGEQKTKSVVLYADNHMMLYEKDIPSPVVGVMY